MALSGHDRDTTSAGPSGLVLPTKMESLTRRADFLAAARSGRQAMPGFVLQARPRAEGDAVRVGYTCSKKVGNAVARNRAKRRLRAVAAQVLPVQGKPGWDYVLIGRHQATASRPFSALITDLQTAIHRLHLRRPDR